MCGIAGYIDPLNFNSSEASSITRRMGDRLAHRGPDGAGEWFDENLGIALVHRRLAILELSEAGSQPMLSPSGRYCVVFNGEIYNHLELRKIIDSSHLSVTWRGNSDTETLVASFDVWGIDKTLRDTVGMFAIAVWDRHEKTLTLARDRLGEKPLYFGWQGSVFIFASELQAIREHPSFKKEIDREALPAYFRGGYVPAPHTVWKGIKKLPPGTYCTIPLKVGSSDQISFTPYWALEQVRSQPTFNSFRYDDKSAITEFEALIRESISGQMRSDVPLGAFLSGGLDSSLVVSIMQSLSKKPINTFTIGFDKLEYNEADVAAGIAKHLGTNHTEFIITSNDALSIIPKLSSVYGEPFGDSSAIPTMLVAKLARQSLKVALTGDGGDELFAGYPRYFNHKANRIRELKKWVPDSLLRLALSLNSRVHVSDIDALLFKNFSALGVKYKASIGAKIETILEILKSNTISEHYLAITNQWPVSPLLNTGAVSNPFGNIINQSDPIDAMMQMDLLSYLPDDILTKVDRAAMTVGLETRVPLLDHRIVEFAQRIPLNMKVRDGKTKWLLRKLVSNFIPIQIIDQPKRGFQLPLADYLRGPLKDWADYALCSSTIDKYGLLNSDIVQKQWNAHKTGQRNLQNSIWTILMFQTWLEESGAN